MISVPLSSFKNVRRALPSFFYQSASHRGGHYLRCMFTSACFFFLYLSRCGMSFRHDSTVTMHIRTRHDHLRPFKCDECGSLFGRLSHLKKHIRKVCGDNKNKEKPIAQCRFCDVTFPTKGDLRKHLLICEKKGTDHSASENELFLLYFLN